MVKNGDLRRRVVLDTGTQSKVKRSFRDMCDINRIISNFKKTGLINHVSRRTPFYGDVSALLDYQDALQVILRANELFMGMDARIRARFFNDPWEMLQFLQDPKNLDEAVEMGLVDKKPAEVSTKGVPVVDKDPAVGTPDKKGSQSPS